ncbi:helix-turn-helix transcriptional regulator [Granulicoccus phenolivorans]|uniref:helix-turn-helix transcriptional regulator n=1 Tax=Granulicoccus phenolivorans TaxID=266854 RepID=UPI0004183694|nr:helix-turn-helix domain-containing protein [Granulicoccus phenolivorans]
MTLGPSPAADPSVRLSSARAGVLACLTEQGTAMKVKEIAAASGQHPNTVREHLDALVAEGLVEVAPTDPQGRGRPALSYRLVGEVGAPGLAEYRQLIAILAAYLRRTAPDPAAAAFEAGAEWGSAGSSALLPWLAQLGFAPRENEDGSLLLTRCPVLGAARADREIVCGIHRGAMSAKTGTEVALEPFVADGCRVSFPRD